ncbi:MAG TPA: CsbD family protein [Micavibrio sp.]
MNTDIIEGKWTEIKGAVKQKWGKLTDDDLAEINGSREMLAGKIQKNYGLARDEVEKQLKAWEDDIAA